MNHLGAKKKRISVSFHEKFWPPFQKIRLGIDFNLPLAALLLLLLFFLFVFVLIILQRNYKQDTIK